ncbi:hypothetical protein GCM10027290_49130 [Micromonospora sonneratiae]|jgi:hypothetical protein|uniref:Uncharacterized protein n=1 Tax=Micromonospora sonneratiae TaxID=1184706 RepID=A0ABW3YP11_9ACTN
MTSEDDFAYAQPTGPAPTGAGSIDAHQGHPLVAMRPGTVSLVVSNPGATGSVIEPTAPVTDPDQHPIVVDSAERPTRTVPRHLLGGSATSPYGVPHNGTPYRDSTAAAGGRRRGLCDPGRHHRGARAVGDAGVVRRIHPAGEASPIDLSAGRPRRDEHCHALGSWRAGGTRRTG